MSAAARTVDMRVDPESHLDEVIAHLEAGGLIAYPTETVYGLGGLARGDVVARVRSVKGREPDKPLLVLVRSAAAVSGLRWTADARELAGIFWPGPLTLVLEDPLGIFPLGVRDADTNAVGVRVSPHPIVALLLERLEGALTSTSLNRPGEAPAMSGSEAAEVVARLGASDVLVLDGGALSASPPSSVVDCTGSEPVVMREGAVPTNRLRCAVPEIHG